MSKNIVKVRAEFHVHTRFSHDSALTKYFLFFMCKIKRIKYLAITDHNEIKGALKYKDFFQKHGITVIVGEEIFTKDGEIIGLYLNERIEPKLSASDTIKEIRRQKGLVYIPHPYDGKRHKTVIDEDVLRKIKNDVDFIECHNGRNIKKEYSDVQDRMADELNITKIIGSDVHTFYEVGRNYCLVNPFTKETLVKEIKTATFHKKNCLKFAHFHTKIVRLIKLIKGGNFSELSRIINKKLKRSR